MKRKRKLPAGLSLATNRRRVLGLGMMAWLRAWAVGLFLDPATRDYNFRTIVRLSGGLVAETTLNRWWRETRSAQPP